MPPGPGTNPAGGDYNSLMQQAKAPGARNQFAQVQQILTRAIQTGPEQAPRLFRLGELNLYAYNNAGAAMQNYQPASRTAARPFFT